MSIKLVHEEIKRFLASKEPEVLCIKGKWGVGKTYAWGHYLKEALSTKEIGLSRYSYISLFGQKSLDDLRFSLFENTIEVEQIDRGPDINSLQSGLRWIKKNYRKGVVFLSRFPNFQPYLAGSERALFFLVRNQIVCIDDLERAGGDLKATDVLGMISLLKEQRGCKVALLLNDEELSAEDKEVFKKQLEKVTDTVLEFKPSPLEAADIVFSSREGIYGLLHKNCTSLGIVNIRVIKKIERIARRLEELLSETYPDLLYQALHSTTLFGWVVYEPKVAPSLDFIKNFSPIFDLERGGDKITKQEKLWQTLLSAYQFFQTDEFDLVVLDGIRLGYFDVDALNKVAAKLSEKLKRDKKDGSFSKAWDLYHDSFSVGEKEVLDGIYNAAVENVDVITPTNLDGTVSFLKEFGRTKQARQLLKHYIEKRPEERDLYDLKRSAFGNMVKDPDVTKAFKEKLESFVDDRDPGQVLESIAMNRGWNPEDVEMLAKLTSNDFYGLFKEARGVHMHRIIKGALIFGSVGDASEQMKSISNNAAVALRKIGSESKLNAKRVASQGVSMEGKKKI
ncbi:MAG: hypothetical protein Q7S08_02040 [bacterium]|nr:hypothetical protein [bacterium]